MTLLDGGSAVDQVHLPGVASSMLAPIPGVTSQAYIRVAQLPDGVILRGLYSNGTPDVLIPLQT